jgi:hypothetical protein
MSTETFDRIKKWAKVINRKPNYDCTHFYLSDNEKTMIIDLTRMEEMPTILKKLAEKEKSYLFIDLDNSKTVRYYAYDVSPTNFVFTDEKEGELLFSLVEGDVLKYIENNISELTTEKAPMSALVDMCRAEFQKIPPVTQPEPRRLAYEGSNYGSGFHNPIHNRPTSPSQPFGQHVGSQQHGWANSTNYNTAYKEREQFSETLYSLVKRGETGPAVDHIRNFLTEKWEDKDMLNIIFRMISVERMDFISLKELLIMTDPIKDQISERAGVLAKFQAIVKKTKPRKAISLLKEVQPNA